MLGYQAHIAVQNSYLFQLHTGPKPPQNVEEIQTGILKQPLNPAFCWGYPRGEIPLFHLFLSSFGYMKRFEVLHPPRLIDSSNPPMSLVKKYPHRKMAVMATDDEAGIIRIDSSYLSLRSSKDLL